MKHKKSKTKDKPISLHPLKPEQALKAFMEVDPKEYEKLRKKRKKGGRKD